MEAALTEMEAIGTDIAAQRDRAIKAADDRSAELHFCAGERARVAMIAKGLEVRVADYDRVIARHDAKVSPWVWYAAGVATPLVLSAVAVLVYMAAM